MGDDEMLNLIQHYRWGVSPQTGGGWVIDGSGYDEMAGDGDVLELARTRGSLREAIVMAMKNQAAGCILQRK